MKAFVVHYKNKYPSGQVRSTEDSIEVYDSEGELRVALGKNGAGQWVDRGQELGALDEHDLSPIPKDARVWKLYADGRAALSDEAAERKRAASELQIGGKILSIEGYKKIGWSFKADGSVESVPKTLEA